MGGIKADEDEFRGEKIGLVPPLDPDDKCNGKKRERKFDQDEGAYKDVFTGYCENNAGKGTEHPGEGRCEHHINQGAINNQGNTTHHMDVDPSKYTENLDPAEEQWIERTSAELMDRIRHIHGREPDFLDRILGRLIVIELHIAFRASDYSKDELVQVIIRDGEAHEETGALVEEVRRYTNDIFSNLKKLGLLEDPESKKADALNEWKGYLEQGQNVKNK